MKAPRTLCIDIGGTGLKALVLDAKGNAVTDRARVETPKPALPETIVHALSVLIKPLGAFDRVSIGFPGVVVDGVTKSAPNLDPKWKDFPLADRIEQMTKKPTRALNDAGVQGFGVIEGHGTEMVLTLGTGLGCALFASGHYVPNLELAHHPFHKGKTYEEYVGAIALEKVGKKRWNKRVERVIGVVLPIFNPRVLYLGGGNAKHIRFTPPSNVHVTENVAGLLGGIALWRDARDAR